MFWLHVFIFCFLSHVWCHPFDLNSFGNLDNPIDPLVSTDINDSQIVSADCSSNVFTPNSANKNLPDTNFDRWQKRSALCSQSGTVSVKGKKVNPDPSTSLEVEGNLCSNPEKPYPVTCAGPEVKVPFLEFVLAYVGSCEAGHKSEITIIPVYLGIKQTPVARYCCHTTC